MAPVTNAAVAVINGLFTVPVDFGNSAFHTYVDRYLEIAAHTNGGGAFITLTPRQFIAPAPMAQIAAKASLASSATTADAGPSALRLLRSAPSGFDRTTTTF